LAGRSIATTRWFVACIALVLTACSGSATSINVHATTTIVVSTAVPPRVDLIDEAVTALEAKLGAPQQYFEINATSKLVNLIVALNDDKVAQAWVYLDGDLSSTEGQPATGFSFNGSALDFDPIKVLSKLQAELPQSSPDLFFVEGGAGGIVRYSVEVTSSQGGQLVVVVGPDGTVQSVDPT
jgi:hypothetical protein